MLATLKDQIKIVQLLLDAPGIDINIQEFNDSQTAQSFAAKRGNRKII